MANEIYTTAQLTATKGGAKVTNSISKRQNMAGDDMVQNTQLIGTTSELVVFGEITGAPVQCLITNLDTTNYVELGGDTGITVFSLKLLPGTSTLFAPTSATLYAKANTASCRLQIIAVEA